LPVKKNVEEKNVGNYFVGSQQFCSFYLAELFRDSTPVRTMRSSDVAVPPFILKIIGDRSFFLRQDQDAWNSFLQSLCAGVLTRTDATPGTVSALLRRYFVTAHFDGLTYESSSLPSTCALGSMRMSIYLAEGLCDANCLGSMPIATMALCSL